MYFSNFSVYSFDNFVKIRKKIILFFILNLSDENVGQPGSTPPPYPQSGDPSKRHMILSELPEPPIPLSEIGPIPPPPMFSTPSPTLVAGKAHGRGAVNDQDYQGYDYDGKLSFCRFQRRPIN